MGDLLEQLARIVGPANLLAGDDLGPDWTHDECLTVEPVRPCCVVRPASTPEVAAVVAACRRAGRPITPRGAATGLSGGAVPAPGAVVVSFDRMDRILEIDEENLAAICQPGVRLDQLDEALAPRGLVYPVEPGEPSASIGGTVATNAGGMRAVRYGVTRQHVLGLELVLASGQVLRTGGRLCKLSSGYDLTQLVIGSEGTLALVTEATLKLQPRPRHRRTLLAPFADLERLGRAVPGLLASGLEPLLLEYLDALTLAAVTQRADLPLGLPADLAERTSASLLVGLQARREDQLEQDTAEAAERLADAGALDVYVLPDHAGRALVEAREQAFYAAKAAGADDILDMVVPRAAMPRFLGAAGRLAGEHGALLAGCGHVGDGNVHLSVFLPDPEARHRLLDRLFALAQELGGAVSGEHGLGRAKRAAFAALADPLHLAILARLKQALDPEGLLNPGVGPDPAWAAHDPFAGDAPGEEPPVPPLPSTEGAALP
ncbi:FAD-binding oxidoreductase [Aciditerrimonas ferrireducens]|jgi:glycolate oxidase|uniref:FAD-binding oxidoreductase n=1 Tax=Aciditerrimonas ferrireducens TaxID=667306 RepID=A0ABV6C560_9ACTN